jgi:predicted O-methyltransferase YrrM
MVTRCKDHVRLLGQPEKSAVAEHTFQIGHSIGFSSISILHKVNRIHGQLVKGDY